MITRFFRKTDEGYSPDTEIDHDGTVRWARDVKKGETVSIPLHMMEQIVRQSRNRS